MARELGVLIPKNVLIVDNDINQRLSLALVLKRAGYLVTTVGQACEALARLESGNYHLVILDIVSMDDKLILLPTVIKQYPTVSVMVFTAHWSPETAAEIKQMGISAHLEKPVTPGSLLESVASIFKENTVRQNKE